MSQLQLLLLSLAYLTMLFGIAYLGDRLREHTIKKIKPIIVGLGLTIYCSAWSFYGTTAQAVENFWYFPPTFIGAILLFVVFYSGVRAVFRQSSGANITSIADYLAVSYGRSRRLAILITIVSMALLIPYIALQLKAITDSYHVICSASIQNCQDEYLRGLPDTALVVAFVLCVFSIAFGTRQLDSREHHNGLMIAIAFEAIVKLGAFVVLAWFAAYVVFSGVEDIFMQVAQSPELMALLEEKRGQGGGYYTAVALGLIATICLPRQFHVLIVESDRLKGLEPVRWIFPLYLTIFGLCVLPIAYAGLVVFHGSAVNPEQYVLQLSMLSNNDRITLLTFIGGLSAGSSMVIVACVAMSTMACNEIVLPILLKNRYINVNVNADVTHLIRVTRRLIIVALIILSYLYYRLLAGNSALGEIGLLSFALVAQFSPAILFSVLLTSKRREKLAEAAIAGIAGGFLVWCYTLLIPALVEADIVMGDIINNGPWGVQWLRPTALFGLNFSPLTHGVLLSLSVNIACFVYFSKNPSSLLPKGASNYAERITYAQLRSLLCQFLGEKQSGLALQHYSDFSDKTGYASQQDIHMIENVLSGVIGAVSAQYVIEHCFSGEENDEVLITKTSEVFHFGRELLQESIDNISQGLCVIDARQKMVAWNRTYLTFFHYPEGMVHVGRHVGDMIRFNALKGGVDEASVDAYVLKRLRYMASGTPFVHTYNHYDGRVFEIQGCSTGSGGYVTTFTDITQYQNTLNALRDARLNLEKSVRDRTEQLHTMNTQLKSANRKKTHFLAAAGHDLIQPINAARLFATALNQRLSSPETKAIVGNLEQSLVSADSIITELMEISRLDAGEMRPNPETFCIGPILMSLYKEFSMTAQNKSLELRCEYSSLRVDSDMMLIKRALQNLIANAIRYTEKGKILIGARRTQSTVTVEVWDQGCGFPESKKEAIFQEFFRLDNSKNDGGLGLGLATVRRLCQLLDVNIAVHSEQGRGSCFRILLKRSNDDSSLIPDRDSRLNEGEVLKGLRIVCIDNEASILSAMKSVIEPWGCEYYGCIGLDYAIPWMPDVLLIDYNLNDDNTGFHVAEKLVNFFGGHIPVVIISADQSQSIKKQVKSLGYYYLRKPLKAASLWSVLARIKAMKNEHALVLDSE